MLKNELFYLQASTHYKFWLCALTAVGEGPARAAVIQSGVEPVLPDAPRNLALSNIEAFSVLLQFTHGFDGNSSISLWTVQVKYGLIHFCYSFLNGNINQTNKIIEK